MERATYPFQDFSSTDLPDEEWKDIPNLENYYQISNKGRVRRLAHQRITKQGISIPVTDLILCQQVRPTFNAHTNDYRFSIRFSVGLNGKKHHISTARIVYHCFTAPFDLKNTKLVVLFKDNDSLNVSAENLYLGTPAEKFAVMVRQNRWKNSLTEADPVVKEAIRQKSKQAYEKLRVNEISQYDLNGKFICSYLDAVEAGKMVNVSASHIASAARNKDKYTAGGYLWRRGNAPQVDIAEVMKKPNAHLSPLVKNLKRIGQYDLQGQLIQAFSTVSEACKYMGINNDSGLRAALSGKQYTCQGFIWRKGNAPRIVLKEPTSKTSYLLSPWSADARKITQYDFDGIRIQTFPNVHTAARETGISRSSIQRMLSGKYITAGDYLWQHGEALRIDLKPLKQHRHFWNSKLGIYLKAKREINKKELGNRMSTGATSNSFGQEAKQEQGNGGDREAIAHQLDKARKDGIAEGVEKERTKARAEKLEIARKLKFGGISETFIANTTKLPIDVIEKL